MENFWEELYNKQGTLWDYHPSNSALTALKLFQENDFKNILIPGVGYGRNAKPFYDAGFNITGIEISKSAIELAHQNNLHFNIHHGSLTDMPFDQEMYDAIFCYATLHLFNETDRVDVIEKCYQQLKTNGLMFFNVVSIDSIDNFKGELIGTNYMKLENGIEVYFYDLESLQKEFEDYNIIGVSKIDEPIKHMIGEKPLHCYNVICKRI